MTDIGVRELKTKASQIVRNVRKRRARYVVTYRGQPVAMLVPLEPTEDVSALPDQNDAWEELTRLGNMLAKAWPTDKTSADILSEMRR